MFCACVLVYIEAYVIVPVLGIDSLCVCVRVDIEANEILPIVLGINTGLIQVWKQFRSRAFTTGIVCGTDSASLNFLMLHGLTL